MCTITTRALRWTGFALILTGILSGCSPDALIWSAPRPKLPEQLEYERPFIYVGRSPEFRVVLSGTNGQYTGLLYDGDVLCAKTTFEFDTRTLYFREITTKLDNTGAFTPPDTTRWAFARDEWNGIHYHSDSDPYHSVWQIGGKFGLTFGNWPDALYQIMVMYAMRRVAQTELLP